MPQKITKKQYFFSCLAALLIIVGIFTLYWGVIVMIDQTRNNSQNEDKITASDHQRNELLHEILAELQAIHALLEDIKALLTNQTEGV